MTKYSVCMNFELTLRLATQETMHGLKLGTVKIPAVWKGFMDAIPGNEMLSYYEETVCRQVQDNIPLDSMEVTECKFIGYDYLFEIRKEPENEQVSVVFPDAELGCRKRQISRADLERMMTDTPVDENLAVMGLELFDSICRTMKDGRFPLVIGGASVCNADVRFHERSVIIHDDGTDCIISFDELIRLYGSEVQIAWEP